eukprot:m.936691 g.936691  ORF g.936691 m.936691 type:complete len:653 (+) comp23811_c0_seq3:148-2106(+)
MPDTMLCPSLLVVAFTAVVHSAHDGGATAPNPRHVLLIVADDLGHADLGYTGSLINTSHLDFLATNGVILTNYYVQRACSPTRAALLTGRYNIRYGMQSGVLESGQAWGVNLDETMLPEALRGVTKRSKLEQQSSPPEHATATMQSTTNLNCSSQTGWDCHGGGLPDNRYAGVTDLQQCCDLCHKHENCTVWTVFHTDCFLKTSACIPIHTDNCTTGGIAPVPPPSRPCSERSTSGVVPDSWATHAVGKWHVGFWKWAATAVFRGFDSWLGYLSGSEDYYTHADGDILDFRSMDCPKCGDNCSVPRWDLQGQYSTHIFTKRAADIIEAHNTTQRLFLYLAYQAVHCPAEVPVSYSVPYGFLPEGRRTFAGMLSCLDEGVANVTHALRTRGLWDDTLVFFTTDNGAPVLCGGTQGGHNYPLRGGKCTAWEGGLRGTAFVYSAGLAPHVRGRRYAGLMHVSDVLPTLLSASMGRAFLRTYAAGLDAAGRRLDGMDMWEAIAGNATTLGPRTEVLLEADPYSSPLDPGFPGDQHGAGPGTPYYALRRGKWKVMLGDPGGGQNDGWYCSGPPCPYVGWSSDWNATSDRFTATSVQLYDVEADPTEHHNVAMQNPAIVKELLAAIRAYNASAVSSAPQGGPRSNACHPDNVLTPWMG